MLMIYNYMPCEQINCHKMYNVNVGNKIFKALIIGKYNNESNYIDLMGCNSHSSSLLLSKMSCFDGIIMLHPSHIVNCNLCLFCKERFTI